MPSANSTCSRPNTETLLTSIIGGLFAEGRVPPGAIFNAGAHFGNWACYYAALDTIRKVFALEPVPLMYAALQTKRGRVPNMIQIHGGISSNTWPADSTDFADSTKTEWAGRGAW